MLNGVIRIAQRSNKNAILSLYIIMIYLMPYIYDCHLFIELTISATNISFLSLSGFGFCYFSSFFLFFLRPNYSCTAGSFALCSWLPLFPRKLAKAESYLVWIPHSGMHTNCLLCFCVLRRRTPRVPNETAVRTLLVWFARLFA